MNRRLNPDLFGPNTNPHESDEPTYSALMARKVETELKETNKRVSHLESLIEVLQTQLSVSSQNSERRTEAFSKALGELEKDFREQSLSQMTSQKRVEERFRDQRVKDGQMEAIVDRFNNTLMQFENKLSTLQKVLSEKEMTLMTYRKVIEQIVDEVEKMKTQTHSPRLR